MGKIIKNGVVYAGSHDDPRIVVYNTNYTTKGVIRIVKGPVTGKEYKVYCQNGGSGLGVTGENIMMVKVSTGTRHSTLNASIGISGVASASNAYSYFCGLNSSAVNQTTTYRAETAQSSDYKGFYGDALPASGNAVATNINYTATRVSPPGASDNVWSIQGSIQSRGFGYAMHFCIEATAVDSSTVPCLYKRGCNETNATFTFGTVEIFDY